MLATRLTPTVIEVRGDGTIFVNTDLIIEDSGAEIGRQARQKFLKPGDDVTAEDPRVQAIAGVVWTPAIVAAFKAARAIPGV